MRRTVAALVIAGVLAALGPGAGAAVSPDPTIHLESDRPTRDGGLVMVDGAGFDPGELDLYQCASRTQDFDDCGVRELQLLAYPSGEGTFRLRAPVDSHITTYAGDEVDCTTASGACELRAPINAGWATAPLTITPDRVPTERYRDPVFPELTSHLD